MCTAVTRDARLLRALQPALEDLHRELDPLQMDEVIVTIADALLALDPPPRGGRLHRPAPPRLNRRGSTSMSIVRGRLRPAKSND